MWASWASMLSSSTATAIPLGTSLPERRSSSSRPIALRSLAAQTAVGSLLHPSSSPRGEYAGVLGEVPVEDLDRIGRAVFLHRAHIAGFAVVRDGAATAAQMADLSVTQLDEVVSDPADAAGIRGPHHIDRRAGGTPADDHHRCALPRSASVSLREVGPEQQSASQRKSNSVSTTAVRRALASPRRAPPRIRRRRLRPRCFRPVRREKCCVYWP